VKPPEPEIQREPTPQSNPKDDVKPETPSTGRDQGTLEVPGVDFPYPGYLRNIVAQVYRRWSRPSGNESLRAEVLFFVRRDGSIANFQFVQRSGNLAFDLRAQGAVEAAGNSGAFGPLPEGYPDDVLPVSFFFDPSTLRQQPDS
jgi:outer membrane biosynthesis protein TonB